ncbi:MAG: ABC transporter ATP-binding protein, partial [Pseudomonadota bacterium]
GPSGCGKSTTLRIAAGVERQEAGRVTVDGREVSGPGHHAPPEDRAVGLMFQDFALFPHLNVADNIAFGLAKGARGTRAEIVAGYLEKVGLTGFERKYPHQLSGGEQQRVALARALAPRPKVMLMDEPFSGLDNRLRDEVRDQTLEILRAEGSAALMVTHEPAEAMRMADRIALMRAGRLVQIGPPRALYEKPVDRRAAAFFSDINVVPGRVAGSRVESPFGPLPAPDLTEGAPVELVIRPQHLTLQPADQSAVAQVERARFLGQETLVACRLAHDGTPLRLTLTGIEPPSPGSEIRVGLKPGRWFIFPAEA